MTRGVRKGIVLWLSAVFALILTGCGHAGGLNLPWEQAAPPAGLTLTDVHNISDLQTTFNQDAGKPRLIMLVSPT